MSGPLFGHRLMGENAFVDRAHAKELRDALDAFIASPVPEPFPVGAAVIVTGDSGAMLHGLQPGEAVTVVAYQGGAWPYYDVRAFDGGCWSVDGADLAPAIDWTPEEPRFEVGDRVRITGDAAGWDHEGYGCEAAIQELISPDHADELGYSAEPGARVLTAEGPYATTWDVALRDLEPVK